MAIDGSPFGGQSHGAHLRTSWQTAGASSALAHLSAWRVMVRIHAYAERPEVKAEVERLNLRPDNKCRQGRQVTAFRLVLKGLAEGVSVGPDGQKMFARHDGAQTFSAGLASIRTGQRWNAEWSRVAPVIGCRSLAHLAAWRVMVRIHTYAERPEVKAEVDRLNLRPDSKCRQGRQVTAFRLVLKGLAEGVSVGPDGQKMFARHDGAQTFSAGLASIRTGQRWNAEWSRVAPVIGCRSLAHLLGLTRFEQESARAPGGLTAAVEKALEEARERAELAPAEAPRAPAFPFPFPRSALSCGSDCPTLRREVHTMDTPQVLMQKDRFAAHVGIELLEMGAGSAKTRLVVGPQHLNGVGVVQGGALFTLADYAFAAASNSHGPVAVAIQANICFHKGVRNGTLTASAREVALHPRLATYAIEVRNEAGELVASFEGIVYRKKEEPAP